MESNLALEWLLKAQRETHEAAKLLDDAVAEYQRLSRQRSNDFQDWALRRLPPNPKFDDDWNI